MNTKKKKLSYFIKLLDNPQLMAAELGHEGIMELITLLQNAGFFSKGGKVGRRANLNCPEIHDPWCNDGAEEPEWGGKVISSGLAYLLGEK